MANKFVSLFVIIVLVSLNQVICNESQLTPETLKAINSLVAGIRHHVTTIAQQNNDIKEQIMELNAVESSDDSLMKLNNYHIKQSTCVMFNKYYLTYLKKEMINGKWTIDTSTMIYLDKNGNRVSKRNSVFQINPFYQANTTNKKIQFELDPIEIKELSIKIVVNEVIKSNNIFVDSKYFFVKSLVVVRTCEYMKKLNFDWAAFARTVEQMKKMRILGSLAGGNSFNPHTRLLGQQKSELYETTQPMTQSIDQGIRKTQSFNQNVNNLDHLAMKKQNPLSNIFSGNGLENGHIIRAEGETNDQVIYAGTF